MSTLISQEELDRRAGAEGIDVAKICVLSPRWAESGPRRPGARSALVGYDLIVRDDGSVVLLDGGMALDSALVASAHLGTEGGSGARSLLARLVPEAYDASLAIAQVRDRAIHLLGWETYAARLRAGART